MTLSCYVLDDEIAAIEIMSNYIKKTPGLVLIGTESEPLRALDDITSNGPCDITFVDIDMPELSGLEFAKLAKLYTKVIFTTAYPNYAVEAFDVGAVDYLVKPFSYIRFLNALIKVKEHVSEYHSTDTTDDFFYIKSDGKGRLIKIWYKDIIFIEGKLNYIHIHTLDDVYSTYLTMKEIEESLPTEIFLRIHKSFIINNTRIKSIKAGRAVMENDIEVAIGSSYRKDLLEKIDKKLLRSKRTA